MSIMNSAVIATIASKLNISDSKVIAKAEEIGRFMLVKVPPNSLNKGEVCRPVIAIDIACRLLQVSVAKENLVRQAAVSAKIYSDTFDNCKNRLNLSFPSNITVDILGLKYGHHSLVGKAKKLLDDRQAECSNYHANISHLNRGEFITLCHAAAFFVTAKNNKVNIVKQQLIDDTSINKFHFKTLCELLEGPARVLEERKDTHQHQSNGSLSLAQQHTHHENYKFQGGGIPLSRSCRITADRRTQAPSSKENARNLPQPNVSHHTSPVKGLSSSASQDYCGNVGGLSRPPLVKAITRKSVPEKQESCESSAVASLNKIATPGSLLRSNSSPIQSTTSNVQNFVTTKATAASQSDSGDGVTSGSLMRSSSSPVKSAPTKIAAPGGQLNNSSPTVKSVPTKIAAPGSLISNSSPPVKSAPTKIAAPGSQLSNSSPTVKSVPTKIAAPGSLISNSSPPVKSAPTKIATPGSLISSSSPPVKSASTKITRPGGLLTSGSPLVKSAPTKIATPGSLISNSSPPVKSAPIKIATPGSLLSSSSPPVKSVPNRITPSTAASSTPPVRPDSNKVTPSRSFSARTPASSTRVTRPTPKKFLKKSVESAKTAFANFSVEASPRNSSTVTVDLKESVESTKNASTNFSVESSPRNSGTVTVDLKESVESTKNASTNFSVESSPRNSGTVTVDLKESVESTKNASTNFSVESSPRNSGTVTVDSCHPPQPKLSESDNVEKPRKAESTSPVQSNSSIDNPQPQVAISDMPTPRESENVNCSSATTSTVVSTRSSMVTTVVANESAPMEIDSLDCHDDGSVNVNTAPIKSSCEEVCAVQSASLIPLGDQTSKFPAKDDSSTLTPLDYASIPISKGDTERMSMENSQRIVQKSCRPEIADVFKCSSRPNAEQLRAPTQLPGKEYPKKIGSKRTVALLEHISFQSEAELQQKKHITDAVYEMWKKKILDKHGWTPVPTFDEVYGRWKSNSTEIVVAHNT